MNQLLTKEKGKKLFLLGNEAIVRGSLEAGLDFAACYPGTPSSEIGNTFFEIGKDANVYFEFSTNEKVALEVAAAASACGLRAMTFMKHVGLNVAADAFMTVAYTGVRGGFVMISADDPGCHSSQNEQDNRYYARIANIPMFEPANANEAKDMTRNGFALSEKLELPVLVRTTTRLNHVRGAVETGNLEPQRGKGHFDKDPGRFVTIPAHARIGHVKLLERMTKALVISENSEFNKVIDMGGSEYGVITSGVSYNYAVDIMGAAGIKGKILKLGMTWPLPEKMMTEFIKSVDKLVIVEEGEPLLENAIMALAKDVKPEIMVYGKRSGHFSVMGEYGPDVLKSAFSGITGMDLMPKNVPKASTPLPARPPSLCPGCPHRSTYYAAKLALKQNFKDAIFSSDIGCYTLGIQEPLNVADFLLCMGSSVDAAGGFSKATDQPVLAFLGDSTFFHSGIHGVVNAVYNRHKFVYTILDNRTTAMTGHQPNPGMGTDGRGDPAPMISIEDIVKGCGVDFVRTVDTSNIKEMQKAYEDALAHDKLAVIIAKRECVLLEIRARKKAKDFHTWQINQEECTKCQVCIKTWGCPAIYLADDGSVHINDGICNGCGICSKVCPFKAIHENTEVRK
ncbi:MAG: indolepyruvate ferredoxin oxidoreductase subunit alpha [Candidatus Thermoplasmatota archaeon]|nr:indolepyruvate ferredoxin oxidoreductase subunit alpha [Euryarchaeota archaeon]MBU4032066.1 indolepyruvate ferredoxin oxidoreductase subunit alpha [Candidatus Thermoplasmatota archaeon]MBU4071735.1 indolepyruvate ferredoxin oxidoreductase subunit alpha [Candidatus Thermoplasmatota archaeon]MBU4144595.1 indolepyruvate ferredoxin oxidoreductase subunit alpha [Candidatus Thermoplasmatota archaeon]MBU4592144.1 indolepyruvate ferredoxin oxidoreductase subunit alpha [Candidatus Thermoplasmatota ar